jgi:hypothetical protein
MKKKVTLRRIEAWELAKKQGLKIQDAKVQPLDFVEL